MKNEIENFKFYIEGQVKFNEVDSFGVVHNIQYLYYFEWARIKYLESIGYPIDNKTFSKKDLLMVVHHEIDYLSPLKFFENYKIFCRTKSIGNSSITVENLILCNDIVCSKATCVMVYIDERTQKPIELPEFIKNNIIVYENYKVEIKEKANA